MIADLHPSLIKLELLFLLVLSLLAFGACKDSPQTLKEEPSATQLTHKTVESVVKSVDFLLFKAERRLELWKNEEPTPLKHLFSLKIKDSAALPIGIFEVLPQDSSFNLQLPGLFYEEKLKKHLIDRQQWNLQEKNIDLSHLVAEEGKAYLLDQLAGVSVNRALIFPNDARKDQQLRACFACPHWMAENYGKLEIELKKYQR